MYQDVIKIVVLLRFSVVVVVIRVLVGVVHDFRSRGF